MIRICLLVVAMTFAASIAAAQTQPKGGNVRNAIETANKRFAEALAKGEASKIAGMYAAGARVLPPNSPRVEGSQRIQEFWQSIIDLGAKLSLSTSDVEALGNVAYEVGTYELTLPGNKRDSGKYVVIWKREKGQWKLAVDTWNSDLPAPGN